MNIHKYKKGKPVESIGEIFNLPANNPRQMFYFGSSDRPKHWKVIWHMTGWTIKEAIKNRRLWVAEKIENQKADDCPSKEGKL